MKKAIVFLLILICVSLLISVRVSESLVCTGGRMSTQCDRTQQYLFWTDVRTVHLQDLNTITVCNDLTTNGSDYFLCATSMEGKKEPLLSLPEKDISYVQGLEAELKAIRLGAQTQFMRKEKDTAFMHASLIVIFIMGFVFLIARR